MSQQQPEAVRLTRLAERVVGTEPDEGPAPEPAEPRIGDVSDRVATEPHKTSRREGVNVITVRTLVTAALIVLGVVALVAFLASIISIVLVVLVAGHFVAAAKRNPRALRVFDYGFAALMSAFAGRLIWDEAR